MAAAHQVEGLDAACQHATALTLELDAVDLVVRYEQRRLLDVEERALQRVQIAVLGLVGAAAGRQIRVGLTRLVWSYEAGCGELDQVGIHLTVSYNNVPHHTLRGAQHAALRNATKRNKSQRYYRFSSHRTAASPAPLRKVPGLVTRTPVMPRTILANTSHTGPL